jgi:hypothetical protein
MMKERIFGETITVEAPENIPDWMEIGEHWRLVIIGRRNVIGIVFIAFHLCFINLVLFYHTAYFKIALASARNSWSIVNWRPRTKLLSSFYSLSCC